LPDFVLSNSCRGDTQGRGRISNTRSPLSEPEFCFVVCVFLLLKDVGEIHRVEFYNTLVLPSVILKETSSITDVNSCRGDSQGRILIVNSRSPLSETGIILVRI